jgi:thioredoxin reductase (NADPH)
VVNPLSPLLDADELAAATACGRIESWVSGATIFRTGDPLDAFVIRSGRVAVIDVSGPAPRELAVHGPGAFTGEIGLLAGRPALADAIALEDVMLVRLDAEALRRLLILCPGIGEKWIPAMLARRARMLELGYEGLRVCGPRDHPATLRACEFLHRNGVPHTWCDAATPAAAATLAPLGPAPLAFPVVLSANASPLVAPTLRQLALLTGVSRPLARRDFDVVIIGAGPAGLGAAVYAASEGMRTLVLDGLGPGGQAGSSSRIENYAGFPEGLSGHDLAERSHLQALKFGAEFAVPATVTALHALPDGTHRVELADDAPITARAVILAAGVTYRNLGVPGLAAFQGAGVYYSATQVEATLCRDRPVHVIGAGNSAGQAAMYLSRFTDRVHLVMRGARLHDSMSDYLADRVVANPRIRLRPRTELRAVAGDHALQTVTLEDTSTSTSAAEPSGGVFVFIGATPCTTFLGPAFARDPDGYLLTGAALVATRNWSLDTRAPLPLETSVPGVLAAGDCRAASTKRVAFAVGDGALAITCLHDLFGT